jgi:zinc transport system ATP-binding protein
MEPVLKVSNLRVDLEGRTLFRDLDFELGPGETLVVLGPNGAGKTVLLRTLLGLIPCQGQITWKKNATRGFVPQRVPLNKDLPVTIGDFFSLKGIEPVETLEVLGQVGMAGANNLKKQLGLLSSGQFQRVLIAWALAKRPDVLLFDEPTAGIDLGGEETIYTLLRRTQEERRFSIILVTHDLNLVYSLATRVLCLNPKTSCYGPPRQVLNPEMLAELYGGEIRYFHHTHD